MYKKNIHSIIIIITKIKFPYILFSKYTNYTIIFKIETKKMLK